MMMRIILKGIQNKAESIITILFKEIMYRYFQQQVHLRPLVSNAIYRRSGKDRETVTRLTNGK